MKKIIIVSAILLLSLAAWAFHPAAPRTPTVTLQAWDLQNRHQLWSIPVHGTSRVVTCGSIVCTLDGTTLEGIDANTGTVRWSVPQQETMVDADADTVWTTSNAYDAASGRVVQKRGVAVASGDHVRAERWDYHAACAQRVACVVDGVVVSVGADNRVNALDLRTGKLLWSHDDVVDAQPLDAHEIVTDGRAVRRLDVRSGQERWANVFIGATLVGAHGDRIYVRQGGSRYVGVDMPSRSSTYAMVLDGVDNGHAVQNDCLYVRVTR